MNYVVRKLEINDIKELSKIMKKAFLSKPWIEDWNEQSCFERLNILCSIPTSFSFILVNENNEICGAAIGYVIPFVNKNEYDLQEFFIDPELSKKHLGTFLMDEILKEAKKANIDKIKFYTAGDLYKFYDKFGYQKIDNEYLMEIKLK